MGRFLERYIQGEMQQVWAELSLLGSEVRKQPVYDEAKLVVDEVMRRSRHNIELILARLHVLGYQFAEEKLYEPLDQDKLIKLKKLERYYGPLPMIIHSWLSDVGEVCLLGAHAKLGMYIFDDWELDDNPALLRPKDQCQVYSDPLCIRFHDKPNKGYVDKYYREHRGPPHTLSVSHDYFSKANCSGGGAVTVLIPDPAIDVQINDPATYWQNTSFMDLLRITFAYGGFPGFEELKDDPSLFPHEEMAFLTKDLLPI